MATIGALVEVVVIAHLGIFGRNWDIHALIAGSLLAIVGTQVVALGICAHAYATYFMGEQDRWFDRMRARYRLEHGLLLGGGMALTGCVIGTFIVIDWINHGFGRLSDENLEDSRSDVHHRWDPDLLLFVSALNPRSAAPALAPQVGPTERMFVDWLLFPLLLLAVCLGCGLAVERLAGWQIWGGLLPAVGLVSVIVVSSLATENAHTAPLAMPIVVVLAVGVASSRKRLTSFRLEPWALVVALALFAVYAAPIVLSGTAGFAGYFVDNDAAFHFALIDQLMSHGHDIAGLPTSVYSYILNEYLSSSYPVGADVALGAIRPLIGQDIAWVYQPYLAMILTLGGVALYELCGLRALPSAPRCDRLHRRTGGPRVRVLPGDEHQGARDHDDHHADGRTCVFDAPPASARSHAASAGRDVACCTRCPRPGRDPWIGIPLATFVVLAGWRMRHTVRSLSRRSLAVSICLAVVVVGALLFPIIHRASTFLSVAGGVLTGSGSLGNLAGPLPKWELVGIWPSGDFRFSVATDYRLAYVLIGVALASSFLGIAWMIRRRRLAPLLLVAGNGIATIVLLVEAAYASAKVMMIFSLTAVLAAMLGAAALNDGPRRFEGWALAAVIAGGVLWTNVLAFENVSVAPRDRFDELAEIGARFNGQGPALYNLSDEFALHFLRTEAPSDPADGPLQPRPGLPPRTAAQAGLAWDPNDLDFGYLQSFRLLVLGRSPVSSRPPADFKLVFQGHYYRSGSAFPHRRSSLTYP